MINLIFSMNGPRLTDEQASSFSAFAQWVVLNERSGRLLVDGIGEPENVGKVVDILEQMQRAPKIIGAWNQNGTLVDGYTINHSAWAEAAPALIVDEVSVWPTQFSEIHAWGGWQPKITQEEQ